MKRPRILRRRLLCKSPHVRVSSVLADYGDYQKTYYVSDYGERVGVILLRRGRVLLVSQYRFLLGREGWEIPGGRMEKWETPLQAVRRECNEEVGCRCRRFTRLLTFMPGTDVLANRTHIYCGEDPVEFGPPSGDEITRSRWVEFSKCLDWIRRGFILDGMTVAALLALNVFAHPNGRFRSRKVTRTR